MFREITRYSHGLFSPVSRFLAMPQNIRGIKTTGKASILNPLSRPLAPPKTKPSPVKVAADSLSPQFASFTENGQETERLVSSQRPAPFVKGDAGEQKSRPTRLALQAAVLITTLIPSPVINHEPLVVRRRRLRHGWPRVCQTFRLIPARCFSRLCIHADKAGTQI